MIQRLFLLVCLALWGAAPVASSPITVADLSSARTVIDAVRKVDYDAAWAGVEKTKSDSVRKALRWHLLVDPKSGASFADLTGFALDNPGWPGSASLRRNAEKALRDDTPAAEVAAWYKRFGPLTAAGWQAYARALRATGAGETVTPLIRAAWRTSPLSLADQLVFLAAFRKLLRAEDHAARLRRILISRRGRWLAKRLLPVLPLSEADRSVLALRLRLQVSRPSPADAPEIATALSRLTDTQRRREGFLLDEIRWLRRLERLDEAAARLTHAPDAPRYLRRWLVARTALAHALVQEKKIAAAYTAVAGHRQPDGYGRARSEFVAGWIALRWMKKPVVALRHFRTIYDTSRFSISKARGAYWAGRAAAAAGKPKEHTAWFRKAASYPLTFYGQLAAAGLGLRRLVVPAHRPAAAQRAALAKEDLADAARLFARLGERDAARAFLWQIVGGSKDAARLASVAEFARRVGHRPVSVRAARRALMQGHPAVRTGYPRLRAARHPKVEPALILGIIRQESEFDEKAVSPANARGLMQLIPPTARQMARKLRLRYSYRRLTEDARYNIRLGSAYLDYLLSRFNGDLVLTIASYNAGPNRVQQWITRSGDPRDKSVDLVDWIELIPIGETRNYVQRVLENLAVYRALSGRAALTRDMRRLWRSRVHR